MTDVREHPALQLLRGDAQKRLLDIADRLAGYASWETYTTRPTWAVLMRETGLSRRSVARHLAWLRAHGLLAIVEHGTTPALSPGVLTVGPDGQAGNTASVYLLIAPVSLRLVATARPEDVGAEWTETGPVDAVEASAEAHEAGAAPPPLLAAVPSPSPQGGRQEPRPGWAVDVSGTPSPSRREVDPPARAHEIRNFQDPELKRHHGRWPVAQRPATRPERAAAALEARRRVPDLARLSTPYVAALCREWFLAGWTLADVLAALQRDPDGRQHTNTHTVRHVPGWFRSRLAHWRTDPLDPTSAPGPSPAHRAAAAAAHRRAQDRAARERADAALAAHHLDPDQSTRTAVDVLGIAAVRAALRTLRRSSNPRPS